MLGSVGALGMVQAMQKRPGRDGSTSNASLESYGSDGSATGLMAQLLDVARSESQSADDIVSIADQMNDKDAQKRLEMRQDLYEAGAIFA